MTEEVEIKKETKRYILLKMAHQPSYLIGELISESHYDVVLYYPVTISCFYDDQGMQVITSKYLPFAMDDEVSIVKSAIHAVATPKKRLVENYLNFVTRWRDGGLEKVLEARIVGDEEPPIESKDDRVLTDEPPEPGQRKH